MTGASTGLNPAGRFLQLIDWLRFSESFQFDTDLPIQTCVERLNTLSQASQAGLQVNLVEIASTRYRFEITLKQAGIMRVAIARGILWEDDGIRFVNGEAHSPGLPAILLLLTVICLLITVSGVIPSLAMIAVLMMAGGILFMALNNAQSNRSRIIHAVYDVVDYTNP